MWIKICGTTNLEDAQLAVDAGADALGFVFARSPRQVSEVQVERITEKLPPGVETYGVFVDAVFPQIVASVEGCRLSGVQLHRSHQVQQDEGQQNDLRLRLREHFAERGQTLKIIPVVRFAVANSSGAQEEIQNYAPQPAFLEYSRDPSVDAVLVDSFSTKTAGGSGASFDWNRAKSCFLEAARNLRMIVAGGLRPENVQEAIRILQPWGVDVVSGVESSPGKKDPARVLAFIQAAREAAAALVDLPFAPTPNQSLPARVREGQC